MDFKGYCVRVDALDGYMDKIPTLKLYEDFTAIIGVKHKGTTKENSHYHFVIQTDVKDQAFRVRLRKIFDQGKGNGHMSIKSWDGRQEAIAYLFHEDPDAVLVIRHNVSDATITGAKEINRAVQQMVLESKNKASWRAEEIVYQEILQEKRHPSSYMEQEVATRLILTCLRSGKYAPQAWLVKAMTERILFRLLKDDEQAEVLFAQRIAKNIFWRE